MSHNKDFAYQFLHALQEELECRLPEPSLMQQQVDALKNEATRFNDPSKKHLKGQEAAFLNGVAIPIIFEWLCRYCDLSQEEARKAFLSESYQNQPKYCSGSPSRRLGHPFEKELGVKSIVSVYDRWAKLTKRQPLIQSCPDFAFRPPAPHKVLFEGKYFQSRGLQSARRELVSDAYQTFFYRALPTDKNDASRPDWDYDYACLFVYDASPEGFIKKAWEDLPEDVRKGFWDGANVFVMMLRGSKGNYTYHV